MTTANINSLLTLAVQATGPMTAYHSHSDWSDTVKATAVELHLLADEDGEIGRRIARLDNAAHFTGDIVSVEKDTQTPRGKITLHTWNAETHAFDRVEEIRTDELNKPEGAATFAKATALIGRHVKIYREESTKTATEQQRQRLNTDNIKLRTAIEVLDLGPAKTTAAKPTAAAAAAPTEKKTPATRTPARQTTAPTRTAADAPQQQAVTQEVAHKAVWDALRPYLDSGAITADYRRAAYSGILENAQRDPQGNITNVDELVNTARNVPLADTNWGRDVLAAYSDN